MSLKIDRYDILKYLKHFLLVMFGTFILALGTAIFLVPHDLVTGGVSGIAIVISSFFERVIGISSWGEDVYITIVTWLLFFLGWIFLGNGFAAKTLLSTVFYPIMYSACAVLVDPEMNLFGGYFINYRYEYPDIAIVLAATLGGACVGVGCAIAFRGGGSTGGVDVLAFLLCKIFKKAKSSHIIFIIDAFIVVLGIFVIQNMVKSLLGIISALICAVMIDKVFIGSDGAYVAQIVTDESDMISRGIIKQLDRTATIADVVGAYSKKEKKMVIVSFSIREYADLLNIINNIDPDAFLTITRAHEINGEGWTKDKK